MNKHSRGTDLRWGRPRTVETNPKPSLFVRVMMFLMSMTITYVTLLAFVEVFGLR